MAKKKAKSRFLLKSFPDFEKKNISKFQQASHGKGVSQAPTKTKDCFSLSMLV